MNERSESAQASVDAYEQMMTERLARFIHEKLESHAKGSWKTPVDCKVIFDNLPAKYKGVLYAVATDIYKKIDSAQPEGELDFRIVE